MMYNTSPLSPPQPLAPPVEHTETIEALVDGLRGSNRLVVGSNPAGPTTNDFLHEVLNLRGMMEVLLGTVGRRKLRLQGKSNS